MESRRIIEYDIIGAYNPEILVELIEDMIKSGYQPYGGIIPAVVNPDTNTLTKYLQVVVKYA